MTLRNIFEQLATKPKSELVAGKEVKLDRKKTVFDIQAVVQDLRKLATFSKSRVDMTSTPETKSQHPLSNQHLRFLGSLALAGFLTACPNPTPNPEPPPVPKSFQLDTNSFWVSNAIRGKDPVTNEETTIYNSDAKSPLQPVIQIKDTGSGVVFLSREFIALFEGIATTRKGDPRSPYTLKSGEQTIKIAPEQLLNQGPVTCKTKSDSLNFSAGFYDELKAKYGYFAILGHKNCTHNGTKVDYVFAMNVITNI